MNPTFQTRNIYHIIYSNQIDNPNPNQVNPIILIQIITTDCRSHSLSYDTAEEPGSLDRCNVCWVFQSISSKRWYHRHRATAMALLCRKNGLVWQCGGWTTLEPTCHVTAHCSVLTLPSLPSKFCYHVTMSDHDMWWTLNQNWQIVKHAVNLRQNKRVGQDKRIRKTNFTKPTHAAQLLTSFAQPWVRCTGVVGGTNLGPGGRRMVSNLNKVQSNQSSESNVSQYFSATKQQSKTNNAIWSHGYATCSKAPGKSTWWRVFAANAFNSSKVFKFSLSAGIMNWCSWDQSVVRVTQVNRGVWVNQ